MELSLCYHINEKGKLTAYTMEVFGFYHYGYGDITPDLFDSLD